VCSSDLIVQWGIRDREALIAQGRPVFVELAPVDPRSLMQGDYMRLAFKLPHPDATGPAEGFGARRPFVTGRVDADGVFHAGRLLAPAPAAGAPTVPATANEEMRLELSPSQGGWTLVTDAWFFREGDAERWAAARYGEFRAMPDGRALLVGLADAQRQRIDDTPPAR
jgi:uncharacterized membrane-anchored protein